MPNEPADHRCIVNAHLSPIGQWDVVIDGERRHVSVPAVAKVNAERATATLAWNGCGMELGLPNNVRDDLDTGRLVRLLEAFEAYDCSVHTIHPHSRHLSAKVRTFVENLLQSFAARGRR